MLPRNSLVRSEVLQHVPSNEGHLACMILGVGRSPTRTGLESADTSQLSKDRRFWRGPRLRRSTVSLSSRACSSLDEDKATPLALDPRLICPAFCRAAVRAAAAYLRRGRGRIRSQKWRFASLETQAGGVPSTELLGTGCMRPLSPLSLGGTRRTVADAPRHPHQRAQSGRPGCKAKRQHLPVSPTQS